MRFVKSWKFIVGILYLLFTGILMGLSFFYISEEDFRAYSEKSTLMMVSPLVMIMGATVISVLFVFLTRLFKKSEKKIVIKYLTISFVMLVHITLAFIWIFVNRTSPLADQFEVWDAASKMASGEPVNNIAYLAACPHQMGMVYPMLLLIKLTGLSDPIVWRVVNVIALAIIDIGIIMVSEELFGEKGDVAFIVTALLCLLYIPMILYTSHVYGTLVSVAFFLWAIFGTIKLLKTEALIWSILPIVLLPMSNRFYGSAVVITVALSLVIITVAVLKKRYRYLVVALLIIVFSLLSSKLMLYMRNVDLDIPESESGIPATAYVYMGITSEDGSAGTGSFDWSHSRLYTEHGDETSEYALREDIRILSEYLTGKRDLSFFVEKVIYQWMDPYMGAPVTTCNSNRFSEMSEGLLEFLHSGLPEGICSNFLRYFNSFVYVMAFIGGLFLLRSKEELYIKLLFPLIFVGGFVFYFFWEQKPRYGLSFYICLFPIAAYGIASLANISKRSIMRLERKKVLIIAIIETVIVLAVTGVSLLGKNSFATIDEFFSDYDEEQMHYIDSSYENDKREIHSEYIKLDKGFYNLDLYYESDLPEDNNIGAKLYLAEEIGTTVLYTKPRLTYIENGEHTGTSIFVPRNDSEIKLQVFLDESYNLIAPEGKTWYILMDHAELQRDDKKTLFYVFSRWLSLMFIIDVLAIIIHKIMTRKKFD